MKKKFNYRNALVLEFKKRKARNSRYGIRAFARHLRVAPSTIFEVMKSERHFRPSTAAKVANHLGWPNDALKEMIKEITHSGSGKVTTIFAAQDSFEKISDWKTMAVAKLASMQGCRSDPQWIADRLGLSIEEAETAVNELIALGWVARKRNRLAAVSPIGPFIINRRIDKAKQYQRDVLRLASESLEIQDENVALSLVQMVPFDQRKLKKFRSWPWRLSEQFRRLGASKPSEAKDLYCVVVQVFPLSQVLGGVRTRSSKK